LTGYVERTLYVSCLLGNFGSFIGFWLAFKVAYGWVKKENGGMGFILNRFQYSNLFTGSGLSVLYAFVGYFIIILINKYEPYNGDMIPIVEAFSIGILVIIMNIVLWVILKIKYKNLHKSSSQ
jgi:hypothetical protein